MTIVKNISQNPLPLSDGTYLPADASKDVTIGPFEIQWINERKLQDTSGTLKPPPLRMPLSAITVDSTDASGRPTSVTEGGVTTEYTYNADGSVATETHDGITRTYSYDGSGNLTGATVT